jgi:hypothetical protein
MDRQPKTGVPMVAKRLWARNPGPFLYLIKKIIQVMMQNMYIVYMRGFENKPKPKYIKGSLVEKSNDKGKRQSK